MKEIKRIKFQNRRKPRFDFDLLKLENLLSRDVQHDITEPHRIEFFHILIITHGKGYHTIDFTDYKYQRGTLLTIRKDQIHNFFRARSVKGFILLFTEDFLASQYGKVEVLRAFHLFNEMLISPVVNLESRDFTDVMQLVKGIEAEYNRNEDEFSISIIRSFLHLLIVKIFRIKTRDNGQLAKRRYFDELLQFQQLVEKNCFKTRRVLDYAKMMNCTAKTLNNICKATLNKSSKAIIDDIAIIQIKRLLINTRLSISEIAYTSGFEEPTNLYRYFKKYTNRSPEAFRRVHIR